MAKTKKDLEAAIERLNIRVDKLESAVESRKMPKDTPNRISLNDLESFNETPPWVYGGRFE